MSCLMGLCSFGVVGRRLSLHCHIYIYIRNIVLYIKCSLDDDLVEFNLINIYCYKYLVVEVRMLSTSSQRVDSPLDGPDTLLLYVHVDTSSSSVSPPGGSIGG